MANRRDIKRRIVSVINTQKITKAMKLVAAAKFARASHAVNAARPYSQAFDEMVKKLVSGSAEGLSSPLMRANDPKRVLIVVLATDRGLCGGLNTNLFRAVRAWLEAQKQNFPKDASFTFLPWGRKASSWSRKQQEQSLAGREKVLDKPNFASAKALVEDLVAMFLEDKFDAVYVAHNQFVNALTQKALVIPFLPIAADQSNKEVAATDIIVEPALAQMLDQLLQRKLTNILLQALLDSAASEFGSRMTAMDSATSNAAEVRKKLALQYNRARQAAITKELIEIISGAEAL